MKRRFALIAMAVLLAGTSALAHHGYDDFFRNQTASIEGTIDAIVWAYPHVVLTIQTDDAVVYTASWDAPGSLQRRGFDSKFVGVGDRVTVSGCPSRDPHAHRLALLSEVRRMRDGQLWTKLH
jgi:hypothetical protein